MQVDRIVHQHVGPDYGHHVAVDYLLDQIVPLRLGGVLANFHIAQKIVVKEVVGQVHCKKVRFVYIINAKVTK